MSNIFPRHSHHARKLPLTAPTRELCSGPTVVVPPAAFMASTIADTLAIARAHADHTIDSDSSDTESDTSTKSVVPTYAFAFDIDGVLIKGGQVIPEAKEAMRILNGENEDGIKVPYIFLTNVRIDISQLFPRIQSKLTKKYLGWRTYRRRAL
jgi:hypothetical protein